ncbi:hypothetical protein M3Y99_00459100 [Aphelenchoides fujianensis]|nr:hypothetical protein M3Y99_00459100 [Aphelenchoides fujianensis]
MAAATPDLCRLAFETNRSARILVVNVAHLFVATLAAASLFVYLRTPFIRRVFGVVGGNLKMILWMGIAYYCVGISAPFVVCASRLVAVLRDLPACSYVWTSQHCFAAYIETAGVNTIIFPFWHSALFVERAVAVSSSGHRSAGRWLGVGLCILLVRTKLLKYSTNKFQVCIPLSYAYGMFSQITEFSDSAYCAGVFTNRSMGRGYTQVINSSTLLLDCLVSAADAWLLVASRRRIARYYKTRSNAYTLDRSWLLRESKISIDLILPFSIAHSFFYVLQTMCNLYYTLAAGGLPLEAEAFFKETVNIVRGRKQNKLD